MRKLVHFQSLALAVASPIWASAADPVECDTDYISGLSSGDFSASVYTQFCAEVDRFDGHQPVSWTVDSNGTMLVDNLQQTQFAVRPVAAKSSAASGYTFDIAYNPTNKGLSCLARKTCTGIFEGFNSNCGHNLSGVDLMAYKGSLGSGCGLYTYFIVPPEHGDSERQCYPLNFFGSHHMKVQEWVLDRLISDKICKPDRPRVTARDNSTWLQDEIYWVNTVPYVFSVSWLSGCYQKQMDADFNYPIEGDKIINCYHLLWDNYANCKRTSILNLSRANLNATGLQNGGVGGNITIGCVLYEYKTIDQRVSGEIKESSGSEFGRHWSLR